MCGYPRHLPGFSYTVAGASDVRSLIARAKQSSGFLYKKRHGERLWQRYGYERVVRDSESTQRIVRHVLENPVRKGLVDHPRNYRFVASGVVSLDELLEYAYGGAAE